MSRGMVVVMRFLVLVLMGACPFPVSAETFVFRHDNVLGTSCEFVVDADGRATADAAEAAVLDEIDRMAKVVSTYDPASEISRWVAEGQGRIVSDDLAEILRACDRWQTLSQGGFHPGAATASAVWRESEKTGTEPSPAALAAVVSVLEERPWRWDGTWVTPVESQRLSLDALAKGAIIDAALHAALQTPGVRGGALNIGGDLAVRGTMAREVLIREGHEQVVDTVWLRDGALATSGAGHRGFLVGGQRLSHLIDPRTARPVAHVVSASVVAGCASDADALATICGVLEIQESLSLIETIPDAECLIVDARGETHVSAGWAGREHGRRRVVATPVAMKTQAPAAFELVLELEINRPDGGGRYRRPYVAAWVEDADGYPVKTLLLWVQADGPGPRWIPDLRRWHRADRLRKLAEDTDLVATISEPTRQPGEHGVTWDGTDNDGAVLPAGEYTVCIEAVREHGTYQFDRRSVTLGSKPFRESFESNPEIKTATLEYRAVARP